MTERKRVALKLEQKQAMVSELSEVVRNSVSAAVAEYPGLTVEEFTELRNKGRKANVYVKVVRNTLARRAVEGTEYACLADALVGPVVLLFARNEPSAAARLLTDFVKGHEKLKVSALALGGKLFSADQLKTVASLPSRDEAISILMSVLNAPITKLVRTLAETYSKLVRTVGAVRDLKQNAA